MPAARASPSPPRSTSSRSAPALRGRATWSLARAGGFGAGAGVAGSRRGAVEAHGLVSQAPV